MTSRTGLVLGSTANLHTVVTPTCSDANQERIRVSAGSEMLTSGLIPVCVCAFTCVRVLTGCMLWDINSTSKRQSSLSF